jgi:hypothetical protein
MKGENEWFIDDGIAKLHTLLLKEPYKIEKLNQHLILMTKTTTYELYTL